LKTFLSPIHNSFSNDPGRNWYLDTLAYSDEAERCSGLKPNAVPGIPNTRSERSDAGPLILLEVFGFVKKMCDWQ
jgi:hypothetical protein